MKLREFIYLEKDSLWNGVGRLNASTPLCFIFLFFCMKIKVKFLFLALLGIILIPNTNAYEMSKIRNWSESWAPPTTTRHRGMCLHYNRNWYMTFDGKGYSYADISRDNTSCSEWAVLGNFFAPRDYNSPWNQWIYNDYFSYVNSKQNGEWMDMIRTVYQNWEHKTVITTLPSRTAYKRTSNAGIDYMFTQIYFYHNQFILYDPVKEVGLSFLGKMNVVGGAVFANPGTTEDNLRFIDYVRKKAYSATITNTAAWKWLLWTDVSMSRLQAMNWSKSYTMNKWGSSFLPPNFKIDKQGSEWFQYIEDIEFIAPDWNAGKSNNNWTWNQVAQNYRACVSRWSDIKVLAQISKSCWDDPLDSETLNWVKVDSWNWEWEVKTIIDQLEWWNKIKCWRFANIKKKFYDRYSKEWSSWYKDFNNYSFTPEALDVQAQCGGEYLENKNWGAGVSPFSASWMELIANSLWQVGNNLLNSLDCWDWKRISQTLFEKRFWTYISYYTACRDKTFMPTKYDSWKSYIVGYDYLFWWNNNENVCRYASELKESLMKKYWSCVFWTNYRTSVSSDLSWNVFWNDWKINWNALENVVWGLSWNPFEDPELWLSKIAEYFSKDYKLGNDKAFDILGYKNCWKGLWIKSWDYLVYLFLILFLFIIFRWRL